MYLDLCLLSCDLNPDYYEFFPLIKRCWKRNVGIDCILILVADEIPYSLMSEKDSIILFPPIKNIPTAFQAQCIRLLYPGLLNFNGIIISDMDIIPLNNDFFTKPIQKLSQDTFCVYRDVISEYKQYPMCYCAASSETWKNVFHCIIMNDVIQTLILWYTKDDYCISSATSHMWAQDQLQLYKFLSLTKSPVVKFTDEQTKFYRLDRSDLSYIVNNLTDVKNQILQGHYSDFHLPRPYDKYAEFLAEILP